MAHTLITTERMQERIARRLKARRAAKNNRMLVPRFMDRDLLATYPSQFNLCQYSTEVFDQGQLGSCTANAVSLMYSITRNSLGYPPVTFSRLWLYFMERFREELQSENGNVLPPDWFDRVDQEGYIVQGDKGGFGEDGINVVIERGCPLESDYPYIVESANDTPPTGLKGNASMYIPKSGADIYVDTINGIANGSLVDPNTLKNSIKQQLYENKRPVVLGFMCYSPDQNGPPVTLDYQGVMQLPPSNWAVVGGHEVTIVGWDDTKKGFLIQNSWGSMGSSTTWCRIGRIFYMKSHRLRSSY